MNSYVARTKNDETDSDFEPAYTEKKSSKDSFSENLNEPSTQNILTIEDSTLSTAEELPEQVKKDAGFATNEVIHLTDEQQQISFHNIPHSDSNSPICQSNGDGKMARKNNETFKNDVLDHTDNGFLEQISELLDNVCLL
jgi:hypothetical protein